jgi:hypothetical protein
MKAEIVSCHTADSKPAKQEVNGTVILPPLVFPGWTLISRLVPQCPRHVVPSPSTKELRNRGATTLSITSFSITTPRITIKNMTSGAYAEYAILSAIHAVYENGTAHFISI